MHVDPQRPLLKSLSTPVADTVTAQVLGLVNELARSIVKARRHADGLANILQVLSTDGAWDGTAPSALR